MPADGIEDWLRLTLCLMFVIFIDYAVALVVEIVTHG